MLKQYLTGHTGSTFLINADTSLGGTGARHKVVANTLATLSE